MRERNVLAFLNFGVGSCAYCRRRRKYVDAKSCPICDFEGHQVSQRLYFEPLRDANFCGTFWGIFNSGFVAHRNILAQNLVGWLWPDLVGSGQLWPALAGSGWLWLALAGSGWL